MRRHLELPDVDADASEASVRPWVLGRPGLDGDEVGAMARAQVTQPAATEEVGDCSASDFVAWCLGIGAAQSRVSGGEPFGMLRESAAECPAEGVRLVAIPVRDKGHHPFGQLGGIGEVEPAPNSWTPPM